MPLALAPPRVTLEQRQDGSQILRSPGRLSPPETHLGAMLRRSVDLRPNTTFIAERENGDWRRVSYYEAYDAARRIGQFLLDRGLGADRPVMILSENSVDHALMMLGGLIAGVPVAPISPAYSLVCSDFARVHHIVRLLDPGLVFVEDVERFAAVLKSLPLEGREVVANTAEASEIPVTALEEILEGEPGAAIDRAESSVTPETVAKYLFTSGSTGVPKGVINTHGMLCANQQQILYCWPFLEDRPPVLVDWLPWNHTFGGNHNFNLVLRHGGTLYIDAGKPTADKIEETIDNLRDIAPTIYFNVPIGYAQLVPYLERDPDLASNFFGTLDLIFYAGSALPQDLWDRIKQMAEVTKGEPIMFATAWGSTETAPMATVVHFPTTQAAVVGLPAPGVEIKMVPCGAKLELRVRGPNVTPGYVGDPEGTAAAFDEEGFYKIGDAGRLADLADPAKGLIFDGRVAEDFKLQSGTWVHVGALRLAVLEAAAPYLQDAVVCGHDHAFVSLLAWRNASAASDLTDDAAFRAVVSSCLMKYNEAQRGSSTRLGRLLLLDEPPSIDAGEITDKGYINQHAVREQRAHLVARLYAEEPDDDIIAL